VRLSAAIEVPALMLIPRVSVYVALAAWALTAFGLLLRLYSDLQRWPKGAPRS
jgi:hypothetical protein